MNFVYPIKRKADVKAMMKYLKKKSLRDYTLFMLGINSALRVSDLLNFTVSDVENLDGSVRDRTTRKETKTGKSKSFPFNVGFQESLINYLKTHNHQDSTLFPSRIWMSKEGYGSRLEIVKFLNPYINNIDSEIKNYKSINEIALHQGIELKDLIVNFKEQVYQEIKKDVRENKKIYDKDAKIEHLQEIVSKQIKIRLNRKGHDPITRQSVHVFINEAGAFAGVKENISTHSMRKAWAYHTWMDNKRENPGIIYYIQKMLNHKSIDTTWAYLGFTQDIMDEIYMNNGFR